MNADPCFSNNFINYHYITISYQNFILLHKTGSNLYCSEHKMLKNLKGPYNSLFCNLSSVHSCLPLYIVLDVLYPFIWTA